MEVGHSGRCHDMPFLLHLKQVLPRVAAKIERDSFNTRGASWGKNETGQQKRRNRQPRWTLQPGDQLYPKHYQVYEECLKVARSLTIQVYEMTDAPDCPDYIKEYLRYEPVKGRFVCPVCRQPVSVKDFESARQSLAAIDTDHSDATVERVHFAGNVFFTHRLCNVAKGERSVPQFLEWTSEILRAHRYRVEPPR